MNRAIQQRKVWARIQNILNTYLWTEIQKYNNLFPTTYQIKTKPEIHVGMNNINFENVNSLDMHPTVCIFPQNSNVNIDVVGKNTEILVLGVNVSIICDAQSQEWAAQHANCINALVIELLEEKLYTANCDPAIYDAKTVGTSFQTNLFLPRTTKHAVSFQSSLACYWRYNYGVDRFVAQSNTFTIPYSPTSRPPNELVVLFSGSIASILVKDREQGTIPFVNIDPALGGILFLINANEEGNFVPPPQQQVFVVNQTKKISNIITTNSSSIGIISLSTFDIQVGDVLTLTWINELNYPHTWLIKFV